MRHLHKGSIAILAFFLVLAIGYFSVHPSNQRNWAEEQSILSYAEINGNMIEVFNVRNFTYDSSGGYTPKYYNKSYDLNELDSLWYVVEPFSKIQGVAHTFFSFGFGSEFLSISIEIRKEKGETFSALRGLAKQYELMYVFADERDVINLRANYRNDSVYLYQINAEEKAIQNLFLDMIRRADALGENPEFYNTLTNTCTTNIVGHVNKITPGRVPLNLKIFLPAYSDELVYDLGLIDTDKPFSELRAESKINEKAAIYKDDPRFSLLIRS